MVECEQETYDLRPEAAFGSGFRVQCLGITVFGLGFAVWSFAFGVLGSQWVIKGLYRDKYTQKREIQRRKAHSICPLQRLNTKW